MSIFLIILFDDSVMLTGILSKKTSKYILWKVFRINAKLGVEPVSIEFS